MPTRPRITLPAYVAPDAALQAPAYDGVERRDGVRVELPFPAIVRGVDATGERFEEQVVLDDFSPCGLSLRLRRPVRHGTRLFIYVRLGLGPGMCGRGARVALHGTVLRTERQPDGRCGMAVAFERHRFLYAAEA